MSSSLEVLKLKGSLKGVGFYIVNGFSVLFLFFYYESFLKGKYIVLRFSINYLRVLTRRATLKAFRFHDLSILRFSLGTENIITRWPQLNLFSKSLHKRHMPNMVIKFHQQVAGPCCILPVVQVVFVVLFPATHVL